MSSTNLPWHPVPTPSTPGTLSHNTLGCALVLGLAQLGIGLEWGLGAICPDLVARQVQLQVLKGGGTVQGGQGGRPLGLRTG